MIERGDSPSRGARVLRVGRSTLYRHHRMSENFSRRLSDNIRRFDRGARLVDSNADCRSAAPIQRAVAFPRDRRSLSFEEHCIFVCFLGADAPARIRPPVDNGAA